MNAKRLPKAIRRTKGELPQDPAALGATGQDTSPAMPAMPEWPWPQEPTVSPAASPEPPVQKPSSAAPAKPASKSAGGAPKPPPAEERASLPAVPLADDMASRRRSVAYRMVDRYATYSGGIGIIPLPVANVAGVMAINIRMVQMLCNLYGVPFKKDRARAILVGLAGGATPTGLAAATSSTLYFLMPATTLIALAVSSAAALTCTRRIGQIFVEHFERGGKVE